MTTDVEGERELTGEELEAIGHARARVSELNDLGLVVKMPDGTTRPICIQDVVMSEEDQQFIKDVANRNNRAFRAEQLKLLAELESALARERERAAREGPEAKPRHASCWIVQSQGLFEMIAKHRGVVVERDPLVPQKIGLRYKEEIMEEVCSLITEMRDMLRAITESVSARALHAPTPDTGQRLIDDMLHARVEK